MNYRNRALLNLARDQPCMHCGREDGTVVAAHSNSSRHGKGKSIKAHDCFIAFLCYTCHTWLDQSSAERSQKEDMFQRAHEKTMLHLWTTGRIQVKQ